jgi:hypothetical protein
MTITIIFIPVDHFNLQNAVTALQLAKISKYFYTIACHMLYVVFIFCNFGCQSDPNLLCAICDNGWAKEKGE